MQIMNIQGKKIFVGLSGGVDSAVSAALLKRDGAQVTSVFIKGWYPPGMPCTWAAERRDAMRVAARLQIPFHTLDAGAEYKKGVIDYLLAEYRVGRTPNPDVMCNKEVKFGAFFRYAMAQDADAIAMGHYRAGENNQSYFLWAVPKDVLTGTLFPVGFFEKREVRVLAKRFNLPVAEKKDSQGICFLGSVSVEEFLRSQFSILPGRAVDENGRVLGEHNSALLSTIGERVALKGAHEKGPWFVLVKDVAKNEIVVGRTRRPSSNFLPQGIPFIAPHWFKEAASVTEAQYRYRGPHIKGSVKNDHFVNTDPLPDIPAPGQSIVFYHSGELVGGGIIAS